MPRLSKTDAALRAVILGKAPLKTKLAAVEGMESISETLLNELLSSPNTHAKLKTKAAEFLAQLRHRREVDRILAEESVRLGLNNSSGPVVATPQKSITEPLRKPDGPKTNSPAVSFPLAESPIEPTRIDAPVASQEPIPAKVPAPAPTVDTPEHPKSKTTPAAPMPIFVLPRGAYLERDEQTRLLQLFRTVADTKKSETERKGARTQLDRTVATPDAARSLFAIYLLSTLDWLERNPEQQIPSALADNSPVTESSADYELFSLTFSANQFLRQQAEDDRVRRQIDRANEEAIGGGMWEGLPAI